MVINPEFHGIKIGIGMLFRIKHLCRFTVNRIYGVVVSYMSVQSGGHGPPE